jgi:hypothetical protein
MRVKGVVECANPAPLPGSWMRLYPTYSSSTTGNIQPSSVVAQPAVLPRSAGRKTHPSHGACMHDPLCSCSLPTPFLLARCSCLASINKTRRVRAYVRAPPRPFSWLASQNSSIHSSSPAETNLPVYPTAGYRHVWYASLPIDG